MEAEIAEQSRDLPEIPDPRVVKIVHLAEAGLTWGEIADELKCDPKTVWQLRRDYDVDAIITQRNIDALRATQQSRLALARKSAKILREWLDSGDPDLQRFAIDRSFPKAGNLNGEAPLVAPAMGRGSRAQQDLSNEQVLAAARAVRQKQLGRGK